MFCYSNYHDEPAEQPWDPWECDRAMESYRKEVVIPTMSHDWFKEEIECGRSLESCLKEVWNDYEKWAEKWLINELDDCGDDE